MSVMEMTAEQAAPAAPMAQRVGRNSLWLIGQPLLLNVLSVVSTGYIARKLGADDYGAFNLGYAQIALVSPLCNLGLRAVAVRAIAQNRSVAPSVLGAVCALRILFTLTAAVLAAGWLSLAPFSNTTRLIGLAALVSMVLQSAGFVAVDLFQGFERSRLAAQPQMVGGLTLTVLSVLALLGGLGLPGFVGAYLVGHAVQCGLLLYTAQRSFFAIRPVWDWGRIRELAWQARPFALLSVLSGVTDAPVLDVLILGALFGDTTVGPYAAAIGLVGRLLMVPQGIADALYPAVAGAYEQSRAEVETTVRRYVLNLLLATLPVALGLSFGAPAALWILFGDQYRAAADVLRLAGWLLPLGGLAYLLRECLSAIHQQGAVVRLTLLSGLLMVVLFGILIPVFGPLGAALAGIARGVLMLAAWLLVFHRYFRTPVLVADLGRLTLALVLMALPMVAVLPVYSHWGMVGAGVLGLGLYGLTVVRMGLVSLKRGLNSNSRIRD